MVLSSSISGQTSDDGKTKLLTQCGLYSKCFLKSKWKYKVRCQHLEFRVVPPQTISDPPQKCCSEQNVPHNIFHIHHKCSVISPSWSLLMTWGILDTTGLMEVIFYESGSPQPSSCTKEQMAVPFLGCYPPTATSTSPGVSSTFSTLCWETQQTVGEAALLEQLLWAADTTLRYQ